jgi:UMF1 family MFS transporter
LWSLAASTTHVVVILTAPLLGALADYSGRKKLFLLLTTIQTVVACAMLGLAGPGDVVFAFAIYTIAAVGFEGGYVFYNAFLRDVSRPETMGRISGLSWGTGFLGGLSALCACSPLLARPLTDPVSGALDPLAVANYRLSFVVVAGFFALFSVPTFAFLRERGPRRRLARWVDYFGTGLRRVYGTLRELPRHRDAARFVLAAFFFTAGVETVIKFSAIYATVTFGIQGSELIALFVLANVAAAPGTLAAGWLADRIGARPALAVTLVGWFVLLIFGAGVTTRAGIWVMAPGVAIAMGATQAIGRSLMAELSPFQRASEFFGFYLMCNKLGAIVGLLVFGVVSFASGSQRAALLAISPAFLVALTLLLSVGRGTRDSTV